MADLNQSMTFLHVTACGADSPGKCELDPDLISSHAKILLCDLVAQSRERGEFQSSRGLDIKYVSLLNIGQKGLVADNDGCLNISEESGFISIFDSSGLALQDLEIAKVMFECV
jgi:ornithine cyclodeaminase/alanine dehydrogenase-like protein (mu-crystallin family)